MIDFEFHTKSIDNFWDWVNELPRDRSHPRHKTRKGRLSYFDSDEYNSDEEGFYTYCGTDSLPLIALTKTQIPPEGYDLPHTIWTMYTEVDPDFQKQGIGIALARHRFQNAGVNNQTILCSSFSEDGAAHLLPHYPRLIKETGVKLRFSDYERKKYPDLIALCDEAMGIATKAPDQPSLPARGIGRFLRDCMPKKLG